jgi:hypothetical protein
MTDAKMSHFSKCPMHIGSLGQVMTRDDDTQSHSLNRLDFTLTSSCASQPICFLLTLLSAQRERPTQNLAHRTKPERVEQGGGGGRAERRVTVTGTVRKQFFLFAKYPRPHTICFDAAAQIRCLLRFLDFRAKAKRTPVSSPARVNFYFF